MERNREGGHGYIFNVRSGMLCGAVVVVVVDVVFVVVRMLHIADTKIHLSHVWEGKTL